jgi:hypothetical protein
MECEVSLILLAQTKGIDYIQGHPYNRHERRLRP